MTNAQPAGEPPLAEPNTEPQEQARQQLIDAYWSYALEHDKTPASVYKLAKASGLQETDIYKQFPTLKSIEAATWEALVTETLQTLARDPETATYTARQKLLAFTYTYMEHALGQRSRLYSGATSEPLSLGLKAS